MKSKHSKAPVERVVKDIRRTTRTHYSAEEKIRIVLECLRGEDSIAELFRREGIAHVQENVGLANRAIRILLGLILIALAFAGPKTSWGWMG